MNGEAKHKEETADRQLWMNGRSNLESSMSGHGDKNQRKRDETYNRGVEVRRNRPSKIYDEPERKSINRKPDHKKADSSSRVVNSDAQSKSNSYQGLPARAVNSDVQSRSNSQQGLPTGRAGSNANYIARLLVSIASKQRTNKTVQSTLEAKLSCLNKLKGMTVDSEVAVEIMSNGEIFFLRQLDF